MSHKNRLFAKYGHICELRPVEQTTETMSHFDLLQKSKCFRLRTVSELNRCARMFLGSQGKIFTEQIKHMKYQQMIHPFSVFRMYFDIVLLLFYSMQFITIPLDLVKHELEEVPQFHPDLPWKVFRLLMDICMITNVVLNFLTGYYDMKNKVVVMAPHLVAKKYFKTYFVVDVIGAIPTQLDFFLPFNMHIFQSHYLLGAKVIIVLRILHVKELLRRSSENFKFSYVTNCLILTFIMVVIYVTTTCSVLLFCSRRFLFVDEQGIFILGKGGDREEVAKSYIDAMYETVIIVCSAGGGTFVKNVAMRTVVMAVWLISRALHMLLLAQIKEVVMARNTSNKYIEMVRQLRQYMHHKQLPQYIKIRLLNYFEFRYYKSYFREEQILAALSVQLKQEIVMHSCRKLVENVGFFKNVPMTLLVRIVSCLKTEIFLPNDVIVKANTEGDCMYFISTGTVAVFSKSGFEVRLEESCRYCKVLKLLSKISIILPHDDIYLCFSVMLVLLINLFLFQICHLEDGSHFGEIILALKNQLRVASVVAVTTCELYRLERRDFVKAIYPYPDLLNKVEHIATDRMERTAIFDEHGKQMKNIVTFKNE